MQCVIPSLSLPHFQPNGKRYLRSGRKLLGLRAIMGTWQITPFTGLTLLFIFLVFQPCKGIIQMTGTMPRGFQGDFLRWLDYEGVFLISNSSNFGFGYFQPTTKDVPLFLLGIIHMDSNKQVWAANRGNPIQSSDDFIFDNHGNVSLLSGDKAIWSPDTGGKAVSAILLLDSGNLVMLGDDNSTVWESFSHPTDTLLSNQVFSEGMSLSSNPGVGNFSYFLQFNSGDLQLFVGFSPPQVYWSIGKDPRRVINSNGGPITEAIIDRNSWKFNDKNNVFLLQFIISSDATHNSNWIAVLGNDGSIEFLSLGSNVISSSTKIPSDSCGTPDNCGAYYSCSSNTCQCPSGLVSRSCKTGIVSPCDSKVSTEMISAGEDLSYFALDFVSPTSKTDLSRCKASCAGNCSCLALFFNNETGSCYQFDNLGSFKVDNGSSYVSFVKVSTSVTVRGGGNRKIVIIILFISVVMVLIALSILYGRYRYCMNMGNAESPQNGSEEDNMLEILSGMPIRYTYKDLQIATNNFAVKLGQGGFGSVYQGALQDGTQIAVKKLEGLGQGKNEFIAEVKIIGSVHHFHLVRLKGYCTEGSHRLLAYEFMAKGSLDKWIFKKNTDGFILDWETRLNIAVGTAKGLAYLHEDCDVKIIHCDIKPENVLLDDQFRPKVSDFGLAKLMTREESHLLTTLTGTRGYLAPERIKKLAISEKSDVYSYGMLLLEIIGGRKNYDQRQSSEKFNFPSFVFKKMEEGNLSEVLDSSLEYNFDDESVCRAMKVALWCIQEDMSLRPSMAEVVQMLEGRNPVPRPPTSSQGRDCLREAISNTYRSVVVLSGPR